MSAWAIWRVLANDTGSSPSYANCGPRCCCWPKPSDKGRGHRAGSSWHPVLGPEMNDLEVVEDPFAHLKQRAAERADRTVERLRVGIAALRAADRKITAESLKQVTRELEPGFAGLSFQVIRRNPRAYALYREAASAFTASATPDDQRRGKRGRTRRGSSRTPRSSYDQLQRFDKRGLVARIRALEQELATERQLRGALAHDQQTLLAKIVRLETEIILLQAGHSQAN